MANEYVNNAKFLEALKEHRTKVKEAEETGEPLPPASNYIGECILKIATHLSYKPNFINYTYREEMVSDGIENCLMYLNNFDPDKSSNPFAYFTQIIWYAFIRRITKEKKQSSIKAKLSMSMDFPEELEVNDDDEEGHYTVPNLTHIIVDDFVEEPQSTSKPSTKRNKQANLDDLFE
mgnify:CR=1 FL=1